MKKTIADLQKHFENQLKSTLEPSELKAVFREVARFLWNYQSHDIFMNRDEVLSGESWERAQNILERLQNGEPVQYITESCEFLGHEINVSPAVLIPRPETEELVVAICERFKNTPALNVLDIGTGSGCIALGLKSSRRQWNVKGIDISAEAVDLARANAKNLNLDVDFSVCNIAAYSWSEPYDVIVSNPPYIGVEERELLQEQVVKFEPEIALFAPAGDVLYFYKLIAQKSHELLKPGGTLCFEIHYQQAAGVMSVLTKNNFKNIEVKTDLSGNERMIFAVK